MNILMNIFDLSTGSLMIPIDKMEEKDEGWWSEYIGDSVGMVW